MQTLDAMKTRHSTRAFTDTKVTDEELKALLEAANAAPVGMGAFDDIHLTVIRDEQVLKAIREAGGERGDATYNAPLLILVSAKPNPQVKDIEFGNASCIVENILVEAADLGLQSIYLWGFFQYMLPDHPDIIKMLKLPDGFVPVIAAGVGHGASTAGKPHTGFSTDIL